MTWVSVYKASWSFNLLRKLLRFLTFFLDAMRMEGLINAPVIIRRGDPCWLA